MNKKKPKPPERIIEFQDKFMSSNELKVKEIQRKLKNRNITKYLSNIVDNYWIIIPIILIIYLYLIIPIIFNHEM